MGNGGNFKGIKLNSMKIAKVNIYNFMGINILEDLEVGMFNTFVGKNDSGKSIIIRALDVFFNEKKFDMKYIYKGCGSTDKTTVQISFQCPVELDVDDLALDEMGYLTIGKAWWLDNGKVKTEEYYTSYDFDDEKYQDLWNKKEQELNTLISDTGVEPEKSGRGKKNIVRIKQIKENVTSMRSDKRHPLGELLKNLENVYEIKLPKYSCFDADQNIDIGATPFQSQFKPLISEYFDEQDTVTKTLQTGLETKLATEFEQIRQYMSKNVPNIKKLKPTTQYDWKGAVKSFDLNLELENELFEVPIAYRGTGFRRLLMVAYFEYLANRELVDNQIFSIEEPETYLHPSAQQDLLTSIIKLSEDSQFFITTHSPVFAGASKGENSILVSKDTNGLSHYSKGDDTIEKIIEELGIKPDYYLIKSSKFLIFVEGPDDVTFVKTAAQKILSKNLDEDFIHIVIGGGSTLVNYAELNLFQQLSGSNKYAVVLDNDNSDPTKVKCKEKIQERCSNDGAIYLELPVREIENYCNTSRIKECAINKIKEREGESSQNPNIEIIEGLNIELKNDTDVEQYLEDLGIPNFKDGLNLDVFDAMTPQEWKNADSEQKIEKLITSIYELTE